MRDVPLDYYVGIGAQLAKTQCEVSQHAVAKVFAWLTRNPTVLEDSITEWMLDYFQMFAPNAAYYGFDRHEEGRFTGADWDWWFLQGSQAFKLRVQAKKLLGQKDHYPGLGRSNETALQVDLLLSSSEFQGFYPVYAFYGDNESKGRFHDKLPLRTAVSIASAQELYNDVLAKPRRKIVASDLLSLSFPLQYLFCLSGPGYHGSIGPQKIVNELFKVAPGENEDDKDGDLERGFTTNIPGFVRELSVFRPKTNASESIEQYKAAFTDTKGILITTLTPNDAEGEE